jgi:decaprenylphospho-beta-D-ribofuranose 2-oxidase
VNPLTTRLFNAAWRWKGGPSRRREGLEPVWDYFYPLDGVRRWNRLYGPKGFVQYQFGVPAEAGEEVLRQALEGSRRAGHPGSLIVLKRMGEEAGMLSFPMPGWMLAMDIPVRAGLFEHLDRLDAVVAEAGGRFYLAKDGRMSAETFRRTTPGYEAWLEVKRRVDPEGRFRSLQSWRLGIDEELKA